MYGKLLARNRYLVSEAHFQPSLPSLADNLYLKKVNYGRKWSENIHLNPARTNWPDIQDKILWLLQGAEDRQLPDLVT